MPKIKFYHIKILLWTYLIWAVLNVFIASNFCHAFNDTLKSIPYYWAILHILPFWGFLPSEIQSFGIVLPACVLLSVSILVAGLLIKEQWARFLVITGMSILFFGAFFILLVGV